VLVIKAGVLGHHRQEARGDKDDEGPNDANQNRADEARAVQAARVRARQCQAIYG
jgi:hypothetical protein